MQVSAVEHNAFNLLSKKEPSIVSMDHIQLCLKSIFDPREIARLFFIGN